MIRERKRESMCASNLSLLFLLLNFLFFLYDKDIMPEDNGRPKKMEHNYPSVLSCKLSQESVVYISKSMEFSIYVLIKD